MYDSLELAVIFRGCDNIDEVAACMKVFIYLRSHWGFDKNIEAIQMGRARLKILGYGC